MKNNYKILCTICARSGSKGLKNKNFKKMNKKPLIEYTLNQALKCNWFEDIIISTDKKDLKSVINIYKNNIILRKRPKYLASDNVGKIDVIRDCLKYAESFSGKYYDIIIDLDVTCPLRKKSDIHGAINKFIKNKKTEILFSVSESRKSPYFNIVEKKKNKIQVSKKINDYIKSRQSAPKTYDINGAIYLFKRKRLLKLKNPYGEKTDLYVMPQIRSNDIDEIVDWKFTEYLIQNGNY